MKSRLCKAMAQSAWDALKRTLPNRATFNRMIASAYFRRTHGRDPLPVRHPGATINDYIFAAMTQDCWSPLQRRCVDKLHAKTEARRLSPHVLLPATRLVFPIEETPSLDALERRLRPFFGLPLFAKPTHSCGGAVDLRRVTGAADLALLFHRARTSYFPEMRESQYAGLPRRIIVEDAVCRADEGTADDYKFLCVHGEPLICQVDHGRGGDHHRRLLELPSFRAYDPCDGIVMPEEWRIAAAARREAMIRIARALAAPFPYVRIDLYDGRGGVYFGEFTFSPGASLGRAPRPRQAVPTPATATRTHYSRFLLDRLLRREAELPRVADLPSLAA